ncbi:MAG: hypothetical protein Q9194_001969 [Teloschistes cf. exilis]
MDESVDTSNELPLLHEKHGRLPSLSKKLNELTSNAFRRFRASNTAASSEDSSNVRPKSYLSTLSFGSRVSSLFGGLNIDRAADDTDLSQAKKEDSKEAGVERTTSNSRRNSQLTYGSTSSFFGNNASGAMYPKEFLEKPDSTTWENETANTSLRQGDNPQPSQSFQQLRRSYRRRGSQSSLSENLEPSCTEASKLTEDLTISPNQHRRSAGLIPSTVKPSRQTPIHLANKSFIKRPSARNRVGSIPPIAPSKSSNPPPSTHIKEHRLMTPISPPHPRTNSLATPFDTSPGQTNHQSSHHKPIFTRTTSSSTAPTTQIPRSHNPPPAPLKLTGGNKTLNMKGFGATRARAIADRESESKKLELEEQTFTKISAIGKQAAADQEGSSQQAAHGANDKMTTSSGAPGKRKDRFQSPPLKLTSQPRFRGKEDPEPLANRTSSGHPLRINPRLPRGSRP